MMRNEKGLLLAALMAVLLLHLCSKSEASNFDCCLRYTERVLRPGRLVGFIQQLASEACDINAVIFYTEDKLAVCANPKQPWVKRAVRFISQKVKRM
ncbi:C-C motif chemokine 20 isoform X2 [Tupaia chinensis]|uniref:C-C motif chemokine 20 isoform X2 n=1 Tax=Tupaia chinensis TaxID=246437 RepID=UPI00070469A7|nr:C-C motif chemokine 20 isoform X2 [Tupaia chinensis]